MNENAETRKAAFSKAKNEYEIQRDSERKKLSRYMSDKGFKVVGENPESGDRRKESRAGKGKSYSSGGRLVPPYNLVNWKWVELESKSGDETVIISLNPYDIDPGSGNIHVLYDRIGIYITSNKEALLYYTKTIITKYELPLTQEDLDQLYNLIVNL